MDVHVAVFTPVEAGADIRTEFDLDSRVSDLRWVDSVTGGFGPADIGLSMDRVYPVVGYLPAPVDVRFRDHVTLTVGSQIIYEGRIGRVRLGSGGLPIGFRCNSYYTHLNDNWSRNTSAVSITSGAAIAAIISQVAPNLRPGTGAQFQDPIVTHAAGLGEFYKMTGGDVVDQITKEGDASQHPVDVMVREHRSLWMIPRSAPAEPQYEIPFDSRVVTWDEDPDEMASSVTVEYGNGATTALTAEATNSDFLRAWGFTRAILISAGDLSGNAVIALRDRELTERSQPKVTATVIVDARGITTPLGAAVPYYLVRAGEWIRVAGKPLQPIISVQVDANQRVATLELGNLNPLLPKNYNLVEREAVRRLRRSIHPTSGGRVR